MRRCLLAMLLLCHGAYAQSASEILQGLEKLRVLGSVLYLAAHPDDENTKLITRWAKGDRYKTGYLSLTRGDGGQNLIGTELGPELGLIRTHELLQARAIDGGVQYFSRANDFGFSKNPEETLAIWDKEEVLADAVWVIRQFRPDVIVTRFSLEPKITHGHHTASAMLAVEAFEAAGDPSRFPEQLSHVQPWQARRVVWNASTWGRQQLAPEMVHAQALVSGYNPLLGTSYPALAARSRSQHKSQGFGSAPSAEEQRELFTTLAGERPQGDLFSGIETGWARLPRAESIDEQIAALIESFRPTEPYLSVPGLLGLRKSLAALGEDPWITEKRDEIDGLIVACLGLEVSANSTASMVEPEGRTETTLTAVQRSPLPVVLQSVSYGKSQLKPAQGLPGELPREQALSWETTLTVTPATSPYTHPYWLRQPPALGMNVVPEQILRGQPVEPPEPVVWSFLVGGEPLELRGPLTHASVDPVAGELIEPVIVAPPLSVSTEDELLLWPDTKPRTVAVRVRALQRPINEAKVRLVAPAGWKVQPESLPLTLDKTGAEARFLFSVTPPAGEETAYLHPQVTFEGRTYDRSYRTINYPHIPRQSLHPKAQLKAVRLRLARTGKMVGYIAGAGDKLPEGLRQMGYQVDLLSPGVNLDSLREYDAIVVGVRAFNVLDDIDALAPKLSQYAESGGTLVLNYNTTANLKRAQMLPYSLELSRDRVTDETSPVRLLATEHPALSTPNRITEEDFQGWVQERGLYFPKTWDPSFTPLLSTHDPGDPALEGGLLVAEYGKGHLVYTGLSFFRQLPAGVPGAYRLFANLVSLSSSQRGKP